MRRGAGPLLRTGFLFALLVVPAACEPVVPAEAPASVAVETPPAPAAPVPASPWKPLVDDGLHDTSNPALPLLQDPGDALSELPRGLEGNHVDWVAALRQGIINPRTNIFPETKVKILDLDVLMPDTAGMPMVLFPHRAHTEWLDCENCHERIFKAKTGANPVTMFRILQGEFCGQCHGAVAFPLTRCASCHSVPRSG